ncbi:MAG: methyltransferase domain-containing protein, partial [Candidatus Magasanikbacteria bacterium]|nr:methyltransferase domain-containing protein [Candidatus Magasanikbacteria bacterium]
NTATIFYNNLIKSGGDLTIIGNEVLATQAIQPFEDFSARDYKRPSSDDKNGMLPPKLARILINLAQIPKNAAVLDPFCGSGTILTEAATMGYKNLIGSDISANAIVDSKQNLEWTNSTYHISHITYHLFHTQSAQLTKHIQPDSVNAIITEPTLGQPLTGGESKEKLQSQANELAKLYIESFKTFAKILKPDGVVLFIIPKFRFRNEWMGVDCVDKIKKTGFQTVPFQMFGSPPLDHLTYHRPNQHLARTIWKFIKV